MKVKCEIPIYEVGGAEKRMDDTLTVTNHGYRDNMVILKLPHLKPEDKTVSITVLASELREAIRNATNVG